MMKKTFAGAAAMNAVMETEKANIPEKERIEQWLRRMEPYLEEPSVGSELSEEEERRILLMHRCGRKLREITSWTGRSEEQIWKVIRDADIQQGIRLLGGIR